MEEIQGQPRGDLMTITVSPEDLLEFVDAQHKMGIFVMHKQWILHAQGYFTRIVHQDWVKNQTPVNKACNNVAP